MAEPPLRGFHAIVSIHDVMPATLPRVQEMLGLLHRLPPQHIALLIVPGVGWDTAQLAQLRDWQRAGYELAGHGWLHRARGVRGLYHRLHSKVISRDAAEHLALSSDEILQLMQRSYRWFAQHDLQAPQLYVPPAWAMGRVRRRQLAATPFRYFETTAGILDAHQRRFRWLPLAGFEADQPWRAPTLRLWNELNRSVSSAGRPLRVALHPQDLKLLLGQHLRHWLHNIERSHHYGELFR